MLRQCAKSGEYCSEACYLRGLEILQRWKEEDESKMQVRDEWSSENTGCEEDELQRQLRDQLGVYSNPNWEVWPGPPKIWETHGKIRHTEEHIRRYGERAVLALSLIHI